MKSLLWSALSALVFVIMCGTTACGTSGGSQPFTLEPGAGTDSGTGSGSGGGGMDSGGGQTDATLPPILVPPGTLSDGATGDALEGLVISPSSVTLAVTLGTTPLIPTQQFSATFGGIPIAAQFTTDKGQIGTIGVASGLYTPGSLGGTATVTATYQTSTATASVAVKITYVSAGDPGAPDAGTGAGGYGGVGGSGEGAPAPPSQIGILNGTPTADPAVAFLYPYNNTVFPQAVLPPLMQWTVGSHSFDGIYIHITETYYEYKGYFAAPALPALDGGPTGPFQNHPVPQSAWNALAYSNVGEPVNVALVLSQGMAITGPVTESWVFAPGELKGTIYYQSYGTKLVSNFTGALGPNTNFGGATLAIKEGETSPVLVAGTSTSNSSGCRVCHSVSMGGATLITQHGDSYSTSSAYALTASDTENVLANNNGGGNFAWPALYPDGTFLLSNSGSINGGNSSASALYSTVDGTSIASTGLNGLGAMTPTFSPDGTHIAYNFYGGTYSDQTSLAAMDFAVATKTFSNPRFLAKTTSGHIYWPSFLPTNDGIVYELETAYNGRDHAGTRGSNDNKNDTTEDGAHSELWWVDLATMTPTRLDTLNGLVTATGLPYIPAHATAVDPVSADMTLNFEPTVNPVPSGGYAWVVFTSRRLYGNVATVNPYWSDPRNEDLSSTPTTKKLWVAAIDLNAPPGTDPSHPAFYLPAQELLAGNARGFWVVDPCQADGTSCVTGDECCGGYCRPGEDGGLECTATQPSCAQEYEKCTTTADCCGASAGIQCIDGFCSVSGPK
jgi:hypothetical protein